ncbi:MAG: hypothetical protein ACK4VK_05785 [Aquificaceae bacterium]
MKKVAAACLLSAVFAAPSYAIKLRDADIDFGIQYRVMYNNSNIGSNNQYDFFRQRLRLNFDVKTESGVGGFLQIEYRGGWGGSSPAQSDPRGAYDVNAFNRLQARGIRYGYLYFPAGPGTVLAGILPANDQVDQMLFSADWDLNIGGIAYAGKVGGLDYRAAYVRLVEGAFYRNTAVKDKDQHFLVLDLNTQLGAIDAGIHYYGTYGKICAAGQNCTPADFFTLNQTWIGPHVNVKFEPLTLHGVVLANTGKIANDSTNGFLVRLEGSAPLGPAKVSLLGIYSSGKNNGRGFQTVHGLLGTSGYWAYTYIFTPHGPSDVNDFGLEPGNMGYGLTTVQAKVDFPITKGFSVQGVVGTFSSNKDMAGNGKSLGTEAGVTFTANLGKHMNLEFGGAFASLGNAGRAIYNAGAKKSVNELFARLQMEF